MESILIISPWYQGHRFSMYVKAAVELSLKMNIPFKILTLTMPPKEVLKTISDDIDLERNIQLLENSDIFKEGVFSNIINQFKLYSLVKKFVLENKTSSTKQIIWIPNIEDFLLAIVLDFKFSHSFKNVYGLFMSADFHRHSILYKSRYFRDWIKKIFFFFFIRKKELKKVAIIDQTFFLSEWRMKNFFLKSKKLFFLPDFGSVPNLRKKKSKIDNKNISSKAFNILLYGGISKRKGLAQIIEVIEKLQDLDIKLTIAGQVHNDAKDIINTNKVQKLEKKGSLTIINKFISTEHETQLFNESDLIYLVYERSFTGSSGVLYQAASIGLPVISDKYGVIGWTVKKYKIGVTCDIGNINSIEEGIRHIINNPNVAKIYGQNAKSLSLFHSYEAHLRELESFLLA